MNWYEKLSIWQYPKAEELAPVLEELGFNPEAYTSPYQLGRDLRRFSEQQARIRLEIPSEITDFLKWLVEQIKKFIQENIAPISLMVGGGIATMFLPKWYKVIGIVPIVGGVYLMLRHYGVI